MAIYQQQVTLSGGWVNKADLKNGQRCKIVSETKPVPSNFLDSKGNPQNQDVAKVHFEGQKESVNVNLNRATINALVSAYGEDSSSWMNKYMTAETEKVRVAGKSGTALYLIPEGFEKIDDENGYAVIVKQGSKSDQSEQEEMPIIEANEPMNLPY